VGRGAGARARPAARLLPVVLPGPVVPADQPPPPPPVR
jgi:hypothetical protein